MVEGWCVWVTGLPGSGKSVVSRELIKKLTADGISVQLLSSDELRKVLTPQPSYTTQERGVVYNTLVFMAKLLTQNGVNVVIDATGNLRAYRDNARAQLSRFIEVYLECPLGVCKQREADRKETYHAPKGIYDKAAKDKKSTVPGVGQPYEEPLNPEIRIKNFESSPEQAAEEILKFILAYKK